MIPMLQEIAREVWGALLLAARLLLAVLLVVVLGLAVRVFSPEHAAALAESVELVAVAAVAVGLPLAFVFAREKAGRGGGA